MAAGGTALPWVDHLAFAVKMLVREVAAHDAALAAAGPVVLDRAVPVVVGSLRISGLAVPRAIDRAVHTCRYNPRVFSAPSREDILTTDSERKTQPDEASHTFAAFGRTTIRT